MSARRVPAWVGVVKLFLDVAWWVILGGVVVGVVVVGDAAVGHARLKLSMPAFLTLASSSYRITGSEHGAKLRDASAQLSLPGSTAAVFVTLGVIVVGAGLVLVILHQIYWLVAALHKGTPFTRASARRMTTVGVAVVVSELVRATVLFAGSWWSTHHLHAVGVGFRTVFPIRADVVLAGGLLVVFAEVFRAGTLLQQDHDLTI